MKTTGKAALLVSGTLIIGILIGLLAGDYVRREGFRKFDRMSPSERSTRFFREMVNPSDDQLKTIQPILDRYALKLEALHRGNFETMKATVDSMFTEMDTLLTPEQKEKLRDWREHAPDRSGGPPPPPR